MEVIEANLAAKYWSKIQNEKLKKAKPQNEGMMEEKPKVEAAPKVKTAKDLIKFNKG